MTIKRNQKAKRNGRGKVCQQHVAIDTEKIREKLGTCLTQPDRVEYRHVGCLSRGKRQTNTYELRARCNGHWLSVQELIAVDELEGAEWERYSGVLRRDLCQIGMLRLMKHYGLDVPLGVRLAAEKAEAIS